MGGTYASEKLKNSKAQKLKKKKKKKKDVVLTCAAGSQSVTSSLLTFAFPDKAWDSNILLGSICFHAPITEHRLKVIFFRYKSSES